VFTYSVVAIAWRGRTSGMALLDFEVVSVTDGGKPTLTQTFVREGTLFGPLIVVGYISQHLALDAIFTAGTAFLTIVTLLHAALRVPGKRAPWDRVAGTQVRYRGQRATLLQ
jgi:hypothetical protein